MKLNKNTFVPNFNTLHKKIFSKYLLKRLLITSSLLCYFTLGFADEPYLLCGPDEGGCQEDIYQYCFCIPYNEKYAQTPYCLDFDLFTCTPLAQAPDCDSSFVFKDQSACLATIFQSEPEPGCLMTHRSFCIENQMALCDQSGNPENCHPSA